jgi:hypothetical protein
VPRRPGARGVLLRPLGRHGREGDGTQVVDGGGRGDRDGCGAGPAGGAGRRARARRQRGSCRGPPPAPTPAPLPAPHAPQVPTRASASKLRGCWRRRACAWSSRRATVSGGAPRAGRGPSAMQSCGLRPISSGCSPPRLCPARPRPHPNPHTPAELGEAAAAKIRSLPAVGDPKSVEFMQLEITDPASVKVGRACGGRQQVQASPTLTPPRHDPARHPQPTPHHHHHLARPRPSGTPSHPASPGASPCWSTMRCVWVPAGGGPEAAQRGRAAWQAAAPSKGADTAAAAAGVPLLTPSHQTPHSPPRPHTRALPTRATSSALTRRPPRSE